MTEALAIGFGITAIIFAGVIMVAYLDTKLSDKRAGGTPNRSNQSEEVLATNRRENE